MKRLILFSIACLAPALGLTGCYPEKRVVWSPDGRWAAVRGTDGLYLSDPAGKLTPRLLEDVAAVDWLPDSKRLLVVESKTTAAWNDAATVLSPERRQLIESIAPKLREEILAYEGDWDKFKPQSVAPLTGGETLAALACVRDRYGDELAKKLGDKWSEWQKLSVTIFSLHVAAVGPAGTLEPGPVLIKTIDTIAEPRVAPSGKAVAYLLPMAGEDSPHRLFVLALDAHTPPTAVADGVAVFPDWSADGRFLVYASTASPESAATKELRLGTIARRQVCDAAGQVLAKFGDAEELAGIAFQSETRVRCLRDGRILFATLELHLPATSKDMPPRAGLFALDPDRQPVVTRMIPRDAEANLPDAVFLFEVSPDERHICVPDGGGRVAILTLATGDVWQVLEAADVDHLRLPPAWRSNDELCFALTPGPAGAKERAQVALAHLDWNERTVKREVISATWPDAMVTDFLGGSAPPATSQP